MAGIVIKCEACGADFEPPRKGLRFCKDVECVKARTRARWSKWYDKGQREKINSYQQSYRDRTQYGREYDLKRKYGITLKQWDDMMSMVNGRCQVCGHDGSVESLCVDHCHRTGLVRGVLCRRCNRAIGQLGDSVESLRRVLEYLEGAADMARDLDRDGAGDR